MGGFNDLGLDPEIVDGLAVAGYDEPSPLQRAAIPVVRRGSNVVLHGSAGAGVRAAYGLPVLDRIKSGDISRALVLVTEQERATEVAAELGLIARKAGVRVSARGTGWADEGASVVVMTAAEAQEQVHASTLKLDDVGVLVIEGLSVIVASGGTSAIEELMMSTAKDCQRIIVTAELTGEVEKLVEGNIRKALHIPPRPAIREEIDLTPKPTLGRIRYTVVRQNERVRTVAAMVREREGEVHVYCHSRGTADSLSQELAIRGIAAHVHAYSDGTNGTGGIGYDVPFDAETLTTHIGDGGALLVEPRQMSHLRKLSAESQLAVVPIPPESPYSSEVAEFRSQLRRAMREEDIDAQMVLIAPLLDEYSAIELAAAASALLRKKIPTPEKGAKGGAPTFTKVFLSVGERDAISAREVVGAITGESGITGSQIGRVDVRESFTIVEVDTDAAERVIRSLNGTSLRGRSVRVDYDRKLPSQPRRNDAPRGRGEGPPRGRGEGPPRGRSEGPPRGRSEGPPHGRGEGPPRGRGDGPPKGRGDSSRGRY